MRTRSASVIQVEVRSTESMFPFVSRSTLPPWSATHCVKRASFSPVAPARANKRRYAGSISTPPSVRQAGCSVEDDVTVRQRTSHLLETLVRYQRVIKVEVRQPAEAAYYGRTLIGDLRTVKTQRFELVQTCQRRHALVGDLGVI